MIVVNEMEDLGAEATEKGERLTSKEAMLVGGAHSCIRKLMSGAQPKANLVERGTMLTWRRISWSTIAPCPRCRSYRAENPTVREQRYFSSVSDGTPDNVNNSAILDQLQGTAAAKPLCHGVKESPDPLPPPGSVIGGPSGVEGSEPAQRSSHLYPEVGVEGATEIGPGREGIDVGGTEDSPVNDLKLQGRKPNSK